MNCKICQREIVYYEDYCPSCRTNIQAASREMYESLKALANQEDWYQEDVPPDSPVGKAYKALAKAEGKTQ